MTRTMSLSRMRSSSASASPLKSGRSKATTRSWTGPSGTAPRRSAAQHLALRHSELLLCEDAIVAERLQALQLFDHVGRTRRRWLLRAGRCLPPGVDLLPTHLVQAGLEADPTEHKRRAPQRPEQHRA